MVKEVKASVCNRIMDDSGRVYNSIRDLSKLIGVSRKRITNGIKDYGYFKANGKTYVIYNGDLSAQMPANEKTIVVENNIENDKEYQTFLKMKDVESLPFEKFDFQFNEKKGEHKYCVALFSDAHIEETVRPESVMGLNEYNTTIAEERIKNYFNNLVTCLNKDCADSLVFASLGDTISGYIHPELEQTNGESPLEATLRAQNLIYNGLRFICEHSHVKKIRFIGIVGNHSRVTKKIQHNNGYRMSYEWLMYQNIKKQCEITKLPIEFYIPESEIAVVDMPDGKRFIFEHGMNIKGGTNTVCGIAPALNRLALKWKSVFNQDKIYIGHFHTAINMPYCTVNSSIIGYNTFALSNGFAYEKPSQQYELYDTKLGLLLTRQIYCD